MSSRQNAALPVIDLGIAFGMPRPPPGSNVGVIFREWIASQQQNARRHAQEQEEGNADERRNAMAGEDTTGTANDSNIARRQGESTDHSDYIQGSRKRPAHDDADARESKKRPAIDGSRREAEDTSTIDNAARRHDASAARSGEMQKSRKRHAHDDSIQEARKRPAVDKSRRDEEPIAKRPAKASEAVLASSSNGATLFQFRPSPSPGKPAAVTPETSRKHMAPTESSDGEMRLAENVNGLMANGLNRCVPLNPTPATCSSTTEENGAVDSAISLQELANFPHYTGQQGHVNDEGIITRNCVMCGQECPYVSFKRLAPKEASRVIVAHNGRGVCNVCDDQVWQVVESKLEVRRCQLCRNFYPWAMFQGTKGMVKQCPKCRSRSRVRERNRRDTQTDTTPHAATEPDEAQAQLEVSGAQKRNYHSDANEEPSTSTDGLEKDTNHVDDSSCTGNNDLSICTNRCVPLIPAPATCSKRSATETTALSFQNDIANYPQYIGQADRANEGTKNCVMCGHECPLVTAKRHAPKEASRLIMMSWCGVCTVCNDHVWKVNESQLEVRRCRRCKKWFPWAAFQGEKGMMKQCGNCRSRGRQRDRASRKKTLSTNEKALTGQSTHSATDAQLNNLDSLQHNDSQLAPNEPSNHERDDADDGSTETESSCSSKHEE